MSVEDKNSAVETVSREKATNDPGSVGAPMSGVVVEVRVKEAQEIKKGDPVCGTCYSLFVPRDMRSDCAHRQCSHERDEDGVGRHGSCFWTHQAGRRPRG